MGLYLSGLIFEWAYIWNAVSIIYGELCTGGGGLISTGGGGAEVYGKYLQGRPNPVFNEHSDFDCD